MYQCPDAPSDAHGGPGVQTTSERSALHPRQLVVIAEPYWPANGRLTGRKQVDFYLAAVALCVPLG